MGKLKGNARCDRQWTKHLGDQNMGPCRGAIGLSDEGRIAESLQAVGVISYSFRIDVSKGF